MHPLKSHYTLKFRDYPVTDTPTNNELAKSYNARQKGLPTTAGVRIVPKEVECTSRQTFRKFTSAEQARIEESKTLPFEFADELGTGGRHVSSLMSSTSSQFRWFESNPSVMQLPVPELALVSGDMGGSNMWRSTYGRAFEGGRRPHRPRSESSGRRGQLSNGNGHHSLGSLLATGVFPHSSHFARRAPVEIYSDSPRGSSLAPSAVTVVSASALGSLLDHRERRAATAAPRER